MNISILIWAFIGMRTACFPVLPPTVPMTCVIISNMNDSLGTFVTPYPIHMDQFPVNPPDQSPQFPTTFGKPFTLISNGLATTESTWQLSGANPPCWIIAPDGTQISVSDGTVGLSQSDIDGVNSGGVFQYVEQSNGQSEHFVFITFHRN